MKTRSLLYSLAGSGAVCILLNGIGQATVPLAFVSTNGSDRNPCSAVQPCRSFNQALAVVDPGGEIVVQDSGDYSTGFTISQSVTIDAEGFDASVMSTGASNLCTISAGTTDRVVLRGISFHGASVGSNAISATQVGSLYVEHCSIAEFNGNGVNMPNGGNLFVTGTEVRACANSVRIAASSTPAKLVAHDSRFAECTNGVALLTVGSGTATGWLSNCTASVCSADGFLAESHGTGNVDLTLTNCRAIGNNTGLNVETFSTGTATIRIANCVVTENTIGFRGFRNSVGGGATRVIGTSPGTNLISGNTFNNGPLTSSSTLQ